MLSTRQVVPLLALAALGACAKKESNTTADTVSTASSTTAVDATASTTASSTSSTGLSDANILGKEHGGDSAEVVIGGFARSHASDAGVKSYAALLVSDHSKGEREVEALAKKLSITPQAPADDTTAQEVTHTLDHLKSLKGHDFDTAFVAHEIADHQTDIADANKAAAAAQLPEVKTLVQKSLPELQKHLSRAQALEKKLAPKGT